MPRRGWPEGDVTVAVTTWYRDPVRRALALASVMAACGGSGDDCDGACRATIHFVGDIGIPADIDRFTFGICTTECTSAEVMVPESDVSLTVGDDPTVTVSVRRTDAPFHEDLQGVFAFDATWSSADQRLEVDDRVGVQILRLDGGNIASTLRDLDPEEVAGSCGCPTIETDI